MSATLGTKPPQDRVREEVVVDVMEAFDEEEQAFRTSRATVADTLKEDEFDGAALDERIASQKAAFDRLQATVTEDADDGRAPPDLRVPRGTFAGRVGSRSGRPGRENACPTRWARGRIRTARQLQTPARGGARGSA
jgi:hypothetical protein